MRDFLLHQACDGDDQELEATLEARSLDGKVAERASPRTSRNRVRTAWWIVVSGSALTAVTAFGTTLLASNPGIIIGAVALAALSTCAFILLIAREMVRGI